MYSITLFYEKYIKSHYKFYYRSWNISLYGVQILSKLAFCSLALAGFLQNNAKIKIKALNDIADKFHAHRYTSETQKWTPILVTLISGQILFYTVEAVSEKLSLIAEQLLQRYLL